MALKDIEEAYIGSRTSIKGDFGRKMGDLESQREKALEEADNIYQDLFLVYGRDCFLQACGKEAIAPEELDDYIDRAATQYGAWVDRYNRQLRPFSGNKAELTEKRDMAQAQVDAAWFFKPKDQEKIVDRTNIELMDHKSTRAALHGFYLLSKEMFGSNPLSRFIKDHGEFWLQGFEAAQAEKTAVAPVID